LSNDCFGYDCHSTSDKSKYSQIEFSQTVKLPYSEGKNQHIEDTTQEWKKIFEKYTFDDKLICKIYKENISITRK
jgi:hypothetical protein